MNGAETTPIALKGVLARAGISITSMCEGLIKPNGQQISRTALSLLVNHNRWPPTTPMEQVRAHVESRLRENGIDDDTLANIWRPDPGADDALPTTLRRSTSRVAHLKVAPTDPYDLFTLPETEMLTAEAKNLFRLSRDPFIDDVQGADDVFLSKEQRYIREAMYQAARHAGFLAVIGESGAGKTTLRRDLIERINRDGEQVAIVQPRTIDKGKLTAAGICDAIIADCSSQSARRTLEAKARQVESILTESARAGTHHVLLIEEAHDLTIATLKYLKRFWELEDGFRKLLSVILVGQPELKSLLDERQNPDAREVIRRCEIAELRPLNGNLEEYLRHKFETPRVGRPLNEIFSPDAYDAIRERLTYRQRGLTVALSQLYPLVVNNTVRKCLNLAASMGESRVTAEIVREV